jgi:D-arabinose 1-dehydrogenase-like Zn-dependent alcohol dehydrogenase
MKAWQFTNAHEPLVLVDVQEPQPGPGDVLIDVKAAGLCHSDAGVLEGAAGTDAGMTSHHAVLATGQVKAGSTVGIIGFGGLGRSVVASPFWPAPTCT